MTLDELLAIKERASTPLKVVHCGSTDKAKEAFEYWRLQDTLDGVMDPGLKTGTCREPECFLEAQQFSSSNMTRPSHQSTD